ncbi:MAG: hypothetical protein HY020_25780 [Burkholderiales bacterium]|nr:hypothetical protein [Burkholderiales bacterium]
MISNPPLTIGLAWNGAVPLDQIIERCNQAPFVHELLLAPATDQAEAAARPYAEKCSKLRILKGGDHGIYDAWNKLVRHAATTYICFHGADDYLVADDRLGDLLGQYARRTIPPLVVFTAKILGSDGKEISSFHHAESSGLLSLGRLMSPLCPEIAYPVALVREAGGLDDTFKIAGDADLYFKVRPKAGREDSDATLVEMTDGGASASAKHAWTVYKENRRIARKYAQSIPLLNRCTSLLFLGGRRLLFRLGGERFAAQCTDTVRMAFGKRRRYTL